MDAPAGDAGCGAYPYPPALLLAERVGFGAATIGGAASNVTHVTTLADIGAGSLRAALESTTSTWIVFDVEGTIAWATSVRPKSNKTVDGRGKKITIEGEWKLDAGTHDIIVSDVALRLAAGATGDLISVRGHGTNDPSTFDTHDLWFHHLDLSKGGDGLLDIRGATRVTISWNHLHTHAKAFLHARDTDENPAPGMRITYHHNYFEKITRRSPQFTFGLADFFNNYEYQWYEFGAASLGGAQLLSEANIYEARPGDFCIVPCPDPNSPTGDSDFTVSKKALITDLDTNGKGRSKSVNDLKKNGAVVEENEPGAVFSRATYYTATIEPATDALAQKIKAKAGPRTTSCQ